MANGLHATASTIHPQDLLPSRIWCELLIAIWPGMNNPQQPETRHTGGGSIDKPHAAPPKDVLGLFMPGNSFSSYRYVANDEIVGLKCCWSQVIEVR